MLRTCRPVQSSGTGWLIKCLEGKEKEGLRLSLVPSCRGRHIYTALDFPSPRDAERRIPDYTQRT